MNECDHQGSVGRKREEMSDCERSRGALMERREKELRMRV